MKTIYLSVLALMFAGQTFAQRNNETLKSNPVSIDLSSTRATTDTTFYSQFLPGGAWKMENISGAVGYVFGTNSYEDLVKAQTVNANDVLHPKVDHYVKGVGFLVFKKGNGSPSSKVKFQVFELDTTSGMPTSIVATKDVLWSEINSTDLTFASFATPPIMKKDKSYAVGMNIASVAAGDSVSIITSADKEFTLPGLALEQWSDGVWYKMNDATAGWNVDITAMTYVVYEEVDYTSVNAVSNAFKLLQNTPNPFRNQTIISYELNKNLPVSLEIYDATGRMVDSKIEGLKPAGIHSFILDANNYNQGLYYYVLRAGEYSATKKMSVIK